MNPYRSTLLACIYMTEETQDRYPLGNVVDVQAADDGRRMTVQVLTRNAADEGSRINAALVRNPFFLRREPNEQDPELVAYFFAVPNEHRQSVQDCLDQSDYPGKE